VKVADDGSVKVDVVKVADDAWHETRPLGTSAWHVRIDIDINFDIQEILVLHATKPENRACRTSSSSSLSSSASLESTFGRLP
jgi:hypothetical protein